jgi:hypothetical protein
MSSASPKRVGGRTGGRTDPRGPKAGRARLQSRLAGLVLAVESLLLLAVGVLWLLMDWLGLAAYGAGLLYGGTALLAVELLTLSLLRGVRTVAAQTVLQVLRTRLAGALLGVLAVGLAVLPMVIEGDGTTAGRLRTLFSWGTSLTVLVLGLVSIFLGAQVVSEDVRARHVFLSSTKPLPRWQYVLGRWAGLWGLVTVLLAVCMLGVFAYAQYLRGRPVSLADRRRIETEVFAARAEAAPLSRDIDEVVENRIRELRESDEEQFRRTLEEYSQYQDGTEAGAMELLAREIRRQVLAEIQSRAYEEEFLWRFHNVDLDRSGLDRDLRVVEALDEAGYMRLAAGGRFLARMIDGVPLELEGRTAVIQGLGEDTVRVRFYGEDLQSRTLNEIRPGDEVRVRLDPLIQFQYVVTAVGLPPEEMFHGRFSALNPQTGLVQMTTRPDRRPPAQPDKVRLTQTFSGRTVSDDGRVIIRCRNESKGTVKINRGEVSLLYSVGDFSTNYLRGFLLLALLLGFLAAMGVFAGSWLSFPVAVLLCLALVPAAMMQAFLSRALALPSSGTVEPIRWAGTAVLWGLKVLLPDFSTASPHTALVDGRYLPWSHVFGVAVVSVGVRCLLVLAAGCAIFTRRELARVQA